MSGMLRKRSIPTALEIAMVAALKGRVHECECGNRFLWLHVLTKGYMAPKCSECGAAAWAMWDVRDSRGYSRGQVAGANHIDALESARQTPKYDCLRGLTVTESVIL